MGDRSGDQNLEIWFGPIALFAFATGYNLVASRRGMPTISMGVRQVASTPTGSIIVGAVAGGLIAHWFLDNGGNFGTRR